MCGGAARPYGRSHARDRRPDRMTALTLDPEAVRRLGYRGGRRDRRAARGAARGGRSPRRPAARRWRRACASRCPRHGCDPELVLEHALRDVLAPGLRVDHPRFFAFVPCRATRSACWPTRSPPGFGVFAGTWLGVAGRGDGRAGRAGLAARAVRAAGGHRGRVRQRRLDGEPHRARRRAGGARRRASAPRATVYLSDEAHSSVRARAARRRRRARARARARRPTTGSGWCRPSWRPRSPPTGRRGGCRPASSRPRAPPGTGAVDPLRGAAARLRRARAVAARRRRLRRGRDAVARRAAAGCDGLELADSLTLDPAQVALPAARGRLPARARRRGARADLRDRARRTCATPPPAPARSTSPTAASSSRASSARSSCGCR